VLEAGRLLRAQGMKSIVDITLGYPLSAPFAAKPYDLLSLLRRHREPVRVYFHVRCVPCRVVSCRFLVCTGPSHAIYPSIDRSISTS